MIKRLYILLILVILSSCKGTKQVFKKENSSETKEEVVTEVKRKGDSVVYVVPNVVYRDTTIYRRTVQGTTLVHRYNSEGQLDLAKCLASAIDEIKRENRTIITEALEKEKTEEVDTKINWTWIIIGIAGFIFLFLDKKF